MLKRLVAEKFSCCKDELRQSAGPFGSRCRWSNVFVLTRCFNCGNKRICFSFESNGRKIFFTLEEFFSRFVGLDVFFYA